LLALVQVTPELHPGIAVHVWHWSMVPSTRNVPGAHTAHCELLAFVQVSDAVQFGMSVHDGHVSTVPFWR
jgi:hypothetical protein